MRSGGLASQGSPLQLEKHGDLNSTWTRGPLVKPVGPTDRDTDLTRGVSQIGFVPILGANMYSLGWLHLDRNFSLPEL
jgi:hypothetical protein